MRRKAFTLAEALVTLALIGVVAALTMPYFYQEFQKNRWAVTYKRSFAETFNTLSLMALEEDCAKSLTCTHLFDNGQIKSTEDFGNAMTRKMAVAQNCGTNADGDCFSHSIQVGLAGGEPQTLKQTMDPDVTFLSGNPFYTFRTTRGVSYALFSFGLECLNKTDGDVDDTLREQYLKAYVKGYTEEEKDNPDNQMLSLCGFIIIDVNGANKPNIWGRDVFGMWVTDRSALGVYPFGGDYDKRFNNKCASDGSMDTRGCAAQLVKDGWKMLY